MIDDQTDKTEVNPMQQNLSSLIAVVTLSVWMNWCTALQAETTILSVWPAEPPGEPEGIGEETNLPPRDGELPTLRLTNVTHPTLEIFRPDPARDTGVSVLICPGGGHYVLAYDKEGTEVAEWLNTLGVTGIVLKYRVPAREQDRRWRAAVQDAQRGMRVVRSQAEEWGLDPDRIGILGFSAGGETAALTCLMHDQPLYDPVDSIDQHSARPDFAVLIYTGGLYDAELGQLKDHVRVDEQAPPMFLVHAIDDNVPAENSILMALALKRAGVLAELHVYGSGGHGFGLRPTGSPSATWPERCADWLHTIQVLSPAD